MQKIRSSIFEFAMKFSQLRGLLHCQTFSSSRTPWLRIIQRRKHSRLRARTGQRQEEQNDGWEFDCRNKLKCDSESYFGNKLTRPSPGPPD